MRRIMWVNVVLGLWLFVSPFVLGYARSSGVAVANDLILGVLLIAASWWVLARLAGGFGMTLFAALCGIWLLIAPFALGLSPLLGATYNDMIVGIVVLLTSLVAAWVTERPPVSAA